MAQYKYLIYIHYDNGQFQWCMGSTPTGVQSAFKGGLDPIANKPDITYILRITLK
jgi:hypothetical protein